MDKSVIIKYILYMDNTINIVFKEDLIQIFTIISEAFNMRMSVLDLNMQEITPLQIQPICQYCRFVQEDLGLLKSCQKNDAKYCAIALETGNAVSYTCHAGLDEALFPIILNNKAIGFFIVGQFCTSSSIPSSIVNRTKSIEQQERLKDSFALVASHNKEKLNSIIKLLEITTEHVMNKKIVSIKGNLLSDRVHEYLIQDLSSNPTAEKTAASVNMSISSINKALKQTYGISFRQYSNNIRLDKAKIELEKNPKLSITEAALEVGFQDPLYFSRMFKKRYGIPPKSIRVK